MMFESGYSAFDLFKYEELVCKLAEVTKEIQNLKNNATKLELDLLEEKKKTIIKTLDKLKFK